MNKERGVVMEFVRESRDAPGWQTRAVELKVQRLEPGSSGTTNISHGRYLSNSVSFGNPDLPVFFGSFHLQLRLKEQADRVKAFCVALIRRMRQFPSCHHSRLVVLAGGGERRCSAGAAPCLRVLRGPRRRCARQSQRGYRRPEELQTP